jgi:hypothetical protein
VPGPQALSVASEPGSVFVAAHSRAGLGYSGATVQGGPITIVLKPLRRSIQQMRVAGSAQCDDGRDRYVTSISPIIPFKRGGRFGRAFSSTESLGSGFSVEYLDLVSGRVGARRGAGTFRAQATIRDAAGVAVLHCDTGPLSWVVRDSYAGKTKFVPLVIETTDDRRRLTSITTAWVANCRAGGNFYYYGTSPEGPAPAGPVDDGKDVLLPTAIGRSGGFTATARGSRAVDFGVSGIVTQTLDGRLGQNGGKGSLNAHVDIVDRATGAKRDECDTLLVNWTAVQ